MTPSIRYTVLETQRRREDRAQTWLSLASQFPFDTKGIRDRKRWTHNPTYLPSAIPTKGWIHTATRKKIGSAFYYDTFVVHNELWAVRGVVSCAIVLSRARPSVPWWVCLPALWSNESVCQPCAPIRCTLQSQLSFLPVIQSPSDRRGKEPQRPDHTNGSSYTVHALQKCSQSLTITSSVPNLRKVESRRMTWNYWDSTSSWNGYPGDQAKDLIVWTHVFFYILSIVNAHNWQLVTLHLATCVSTVVGHAHQQPF